jgi:hypothetical protein
MFVMDARASSIPPPPLNSAEYAASFEEVKRLGGDGVNTPTERTPDQTVAGIYWGYDGTPGLGTPPRLYNQIATQLADDMRLDVADFTRMLALINVAMADAGVGCWAGKFHYQVWRPVTGIREAEGDGNPATRGDRTFTPLGAPASNLQGPNFTPPFPAYPSGHAAFGGAVFQMFRHVFGSDEIPFTFVSDEFNGRTRDSSGEVRPYLPRSFPSFSAAEFENGQSRIYLGIHWGFDRDIGIQEGRRVADVIFQRAFQPAQ